MSKYVVLTIDRLKEALHSAFHLANRQMKASDADQFARMIQSLRSDQTMMIPMFRISQTLPPYDPSRTLRFDVWGRIWVAKTDSFAWDRFTGCYMKLDGTDIGAKPIISGLPDYGKKFHLEYWSPVAVPVEIEEEDRFGYTYEGL